MANKSYYANAVTAEADLVAPSANKAVSISTIYICNTSTTLTANVVVKVTDPSNSARATLAKPVLTPGQTFTLGGLAIPSSATPDKIRVSSDNAVSCYASGDES